MSDTLDLFAAPPVDEWASRPLVLTEPGYAVIGKLASMARDCAAVELGRDDRGMLQITRIVVEIPTDDYLGYVEAPK